MGLFQRTLLARPEREPLGAETLFSLPLLRWRDQALARGWRVAQGLAAFALPAGPTTRPTFEALRDEILADLDRAGPVDAVLLNLHGAMIADGYPDAEGELLAAIRDRIGFGVPLLAELDLHAHLTAQKVFNADVLISYKEYPHVDALERADELFALCVRMVEQGLRPAMALFDCRMLGIFPTTREPMVSLLAQMKALEQRPGVLSVSLVHGFPWGDTPEVGMRALAVSDGDPLLAESTARELGESAWAWREQLTAPLIGIDEAIDRVLAADPDPAGRPFVLADTADNTGIGSPGDSTFLLARLIERQVGGFAIGPLWDPVAADLASEAGIGARMPLRLGGKCGPCSGDPVDAEVRVLGLADDVTMPFGGSTAPLGRAAWVRIGPDDRALDVILASLRVQGFAPSCFSGLGLPVSGAGAPRALAVKSTQHFHAGFAPIAREIHYLATPGAGSLDLRALDYQTVRAPLWPRVDDPFKAEPVTALVFDLGRVLVDIDFHRSLVAWAEASGADAEQLGRRYWTGPAFEQHERGEIDAVGYFAAVGRQLGVELPLERWKAGWLDMLREPVPGIAELLDALPEDLPKAVFSNTNAIHETVFEERYGPLLRRFDRVFLSHRIGRRKPDIDAFLHIAEQLDRAPSQILFFDDHPANVAGARAAGLQAVLVRSIDDVRAGLDAAGLLGRP